MFKRDEVPLKHSSPFPFKRGRGIQGDGVGTIITGDSELAARNGIINQMQTGLIFIVDISPCYYKEVIYCSFLWIIKSAERIESWQEKGGRK